MLKNLVITGGFFCIFLLNAGPNVLDHKESCQTHCCNVTIRQLMSRIANFLSLVVRFRILKLEDKFYSILFLGIGWFCETIVPI